VASTREERLARIADARLYLCTPDRPDLEDFLEAVLSGGVDVVQLREKGIDAARELSLLQTVREVAERHGALWSVNDRADVALASGADVLHLGQDDLPVQAARAVVGEDVLVGLSSHDPQQSAAAAVAEGVDYFCVGPTWETPTKPGRPAAGLELVRTVAASGTERPWFAIGGIDLTNVDQVLEAGATRVVVVRVLTEAADPHQAAKELKARL
jgi:thiamine-phosphate pyrophosphorylase